MVQYEEPKYSLIASFDNFEIRRYEQSIMAITERSSSNYQGSSGGFQIIANYIFGGNISGQRIANGLLPSHIWNEGSEIPKISFHNAFSIFTIRPTQTERFSDKNHPKRRR